MLFLDESGTPPAPDAREPNRYFVIAGVVIDERHWHTLRDALLGMKLRRKIRGEIKWRHFASANVQETNPLRHMDHAERDSVREEMFRMMQVAQITILACVASVEASYELASMENSEDLYAGTYKPVTERFQYYLQDRERLTRQKERGIVICDHRGSQDDARLKRHHEKLLYANNSIVSSYPNLVESLFLQSSNLSIGIQMADMAAGAIWRKYEKQDDRYYNQIAQLVRKRNGVAEGYGLVKFPKETWR